MRVLRLFNEICNKFKKKKNNTCLIAGQLNEHVLISCNPRTRYMCNKNIFIVGKNCLFFISTNKDGDEEESNFFQSCVKEN